MIPTSFSFKQRMKLSDTKATEIVRVALDLMERMKGLGSLSIEVDDETGVTVTGDLGAVGASPDMPRGLAEKYLAFEMREMIEQELVQRN